VFEIETSYESALDTNDATDDLFRGQRRPSNYSIRRGHRLSKIMPRPRLVSSANRLPETHLSSPLAQVFSPVVTDEDARLEPNAISQGISFGPATRRRLTSIMKASERGNGQEQDQLEPFPSLGERTSLSPVHDANNSSSKEIIVKAEDELESGGLEVTIMQRLDAMEQRHQRIEDMLLQLSQRIPGIKDSHP